MLKELFGASSVKDVKYCVVWVENGVLKSLCDEGPKISTRVELFKGAQQACALEIHPNKHVYTMCDSGAELAKILARVR